MLTAKQKGCLRGLRPSKEPKERIYRLKGGIEVRLRKPYSLRKRGGFIDLFRGRGREAIHSFCNGVTAEEIEKYVLGYEADLQRKKEGKKVVRPKIVRIDGNTRLMRYFEERDTLREKVPFENKKKFVRGFLRAYFGK